MFLSFHFFLNFKSLTFFGMDCLFDILLQSWWIKSDIWSRSVAHCSRQFSTCRRERCNATTGGQHQPHPHRRRQFQALRAPSAPSLATFRTWLKTFLFTEPHPDFRLIWHFRVYTLSISEVRKLRPSGRMLPAGVYYAARRHINVAIPRRY